MAEFIDKEIAIQTIIDNFTCYFPNVTKAVRKIPAADVQLVKRGRWDGYICSECNVCADYFISGDFYFDEKPNFCPQCGARMSEE